MSLSIRIVTFSTFCSLGRHLAEQYKKQFPNCNQQLFLKVAANIAKRTQQLLISKSYFSLRDICETYNT